MCGVSQESEVHPGNESRVAIGMEMSSRNHLGWSCFWAMPGWMYWEQNTTYGTCIMAKLDKLKWVITKVEVRRQKLKIVCILPWKLSMKAMIICMWIVEKYHCHSKCIQFDNVHHPTSTVAMALIPKQTRTASVPPTETVSFQVFISTAQFYWYIATIVLVPLLYPVCAYCTSFQIQIQARNLKSIGSSDPRSHSLIISVTM